MGNAPLPINQLPIDDRSPAAPGLPLALTLRAGTPERRSSYVVLRSGSQVHSARLAVQVKEQINRTNPALCAQPPESLCFLYGVST